MTRSSFEVQKAHTFTVPTIAGARQSCRSRRPVPGIASSVGSFIARKWSKYDRSDASCALTMAYHACGILDSAVINRSPMPNRRTASGRVYIGSVRNRQSVRHHEEDNLVARSSGARQKSLTSTFWKIRLQMGGSILSPYRSGAILACRTNTSGSLALTRFSMRRREVSSARAPIITDFRAPEGSVRKSLLVFMVRGDLAAARSPAINRHSASYDQSMDFVMSGS